MTNTKRFRGDDPALADVTFPPCPDACVGQNKFLAAMRKHLVCDDEQFERVLRGRQKMIDMRQQDWDTMPLERFLLRWMPLDETDI